MSGESADTRVKVSRNLRVGHSWADVHITQLSERASAQGARQTADWQRPADDLQPMRLDLPGVQPEDQVPTSRPRPTHGGDGGV